MSAGILSVAIGWFGAALLGFHEAFRSRILHWIGVPITGNVPINVFGMAASRTAVTPVAAYYAGSWLLTLVCIAAAGLFLAICLWSHLSRSVMVFALAVLAISAVDSLISPVGNGDSRFFTGFWLPCEFAIWILTPWIVAILALIIVPSWWARIFWMSVAPAYSVVSSPVRLAFCAALLYGTGPVLTVLLWVAFGVLAELVSLCLIYSLMAYHASTIYQRSRTDG